MCCPFIFLAAKDGEVNNSKTYYKFRFDGILPMKISQALVVVKQWCWNWIDLLMPSSFLIRIYIFMYSQMSYFVLYSIDYSLVSPIRSQHVMGYQPI